MVPLFLFSFNRLIVDCKNSGNKLLEVIIVTCYRDVKRIVSKLISMMFFNRIHDILERNLRIEESIE